MSHRDLNVTAPEGLLANRTLAPDALATDQQNLSYRRMARATSYTVAAPSRRGSVRQRLAGIWEVHELDNSTIAPIESQLVRMVGLSKGFLVEGVIDPFPGSAAPLSMLDRFIEVLHSRARLLSAARLKAFGLQLKSLLTSEASFHEAGVRPSVSSLEGLLEMLRLNPTFKHPNLSIDHRGNFVASWSPYPRVKLSLTFTSIVGGTWVASDRTQSKAGKGSGRFNVGNLAAINSNFASWMIA